jgi:uncharacterized protein YjiS (DUF1127 family)
LFWCSAALASAALILQPSFWAMIAAMAIAVAALDAIRAPMLAAAIDHTDHRQGTTLGFAFVLMEGVGALGALLAGLAAGVSWPHMFGLAAILALGASALAFTTRFGPLPQAAPAQAPGLVTIWRDRLRLRRALAAMLAANPHLIDDIGMTMPAAAAESAKPFWQA